MSQRLVTSAQVRRRHRAVSRPSNRPAVSHRDVARRRQRRPRSRPRAADDDLSVNHGGVLVVSVTDVSLSPIAVTQPTTFKVVCAQSAIGRSSVIVVVLHRPGSEAVQQKFFDELAYVLDRFATHQTTSPTHSSASIGSGLRRRYACGSRRPCSCTRPLMKLRRHT